MTNYKQFYNSWQSFAKPKRQLLLEELKLPISIEIGDFLRLTTTPQDLENIKYNISRGGFKNDGEGSLIVIVDESGNAKVTNHEGRHRAVTAKLKMMKEKGIRLMEMLPALVKDAASKSGDIGSEQDVEREVDHILLLGYPDKIKVNIDNMTKNLISEVDDISDREKINILLIIENKDQGFQYSDIRQFVGQFDKTATVPRTATLSRQTNIDASDPIKIGQSLDILGYDVDVGYNLHSAGIQNVLYKKYSGSSQFQKNGLREYVKLLANAYTVVDNKGNEYEIVFTTGQPDFLSRNERDPEKQGKRWITSTNNIHLKPHPYIVYGDTIEAKEKVNSEITFTIKKKW